MKAYIIKNSKTEAHAANLTKLGYQVTEHEDRIEIECSGFAEAVTVGDLQKLVAERKLLTYSSRVTFEDGKTLYGVPACCKLGKASCLVAKAEKKEVRSYLGL